MRRRFRVKLQFPGDPLNGRVHQVQVLALVHEVAHWSVRKDLRYALRHTRPHTVSFGLGAIAIWVMPKY